jgi:hypothetical protein
MKSLLLSALLLFCSSALFAEAQHPQATTPLLMAIEQAVGSLDLPASLGIPAPEPKTCTANQTCPDNGCPISCMGNMTCTVGSSSVTCDGNTTNCPYPSCVPPVSPCIDGCGYCQCRAAGGGQHFCVVSYCLE